METRLILDLNDHDNIITEVTSSEDQPDRIKMNLTAYRLENFKSFQDTEWIRLQKLVMIYGENSAGKTAIHQPLLYLKNAYESEIKHQSIYSVSQLDESNAQLEDVINKAHACEGMSILFKFISFEKEYIYRINIQSRSGIEVETAELIYDDTELNLNEYFNFSNVFFVKGKLEKADPQIVAIVAGIMDELRRFAKELAFMCPIRKLPEREYIFHNSKPDDIGRNGENTYAKLYSLIDEGEYENSILSRWVDDFGFKLKWEPLGQNRGKFVLVDTNSNIESNLIDNGFGIGQSLPVMTVMATSENSSLLIDSPEAFLQTNMQTRLGDYIIECAAKNQLLMVETGSEYILQRIRRRIAEHKLAPNDFIVVFVYEKDGYAICKEISFDKRGNMKQNDEAFQQFFSSAYEDIMATMLVNAGAKE